MSVHLTTLSLSNFRSYESLRLDNLGSGLVVLYGANGAGKTNLLEAVSLLAPGRGIRGAKNDDIQRRTMGASPWAVAGKVSCNFRDVQLGTGIDPASQKRTVRIDGQVAKSQSSLADHVSCVWLTPQMDRLFLDSSSHRRKFFDRLIFAFDSGHAGRVTRYENAMGQRSKILRGAAEKNLIPDDVWLTTLENQMAESASAIAAARRSFITRLQNACDQAQGQDNPFPRAQLQLRGTIEELMGHSSALDIEDLFKSQLKQSRPRDAILGGAQTGPHKTDLLVSYAKKNMPAEQCSTGEQKALLIGIVLAHATLIAAERGAPPFLLLDEVAAHLDETRRAALYQLLQNLGGQVWLTGTDRNLFEAIEHKAQFFNVQPNGVTEDSSLSCAV